MEADVRETPEFRRWREEALPPIVTAAVDAIRKEPTSIKAVNRLVNDAVKQALSNLIILIERRPSQEDFIAYAACFISAVNETLPEISDYIAVVVNFPKDGRSTIGVIEKKAIKTGKSLKGAVIFLELPNVTRDDRNEFDLRSE